MLAFVSKPSRHSLPHLRRRADDPSTHEGTQVFHEDTAMDVRHQKQVGRPLHPLVLLEVLLDHLHNLIQHFWVRQPLPLHQAVKGGLGGGSQRSM